MIKVKSYRYLIIGGTSFIGINLMSGLLKKKYHVKLFTRNNNKLPFNIEPEVEIIKGDLENTYDIKNALDKVDIIIYLASTSNVFTSTKNIFEDNKNISLFLNLMEVAKHSNIKKIIFASSGGTVYGEPQYLPIDENHPLNPLSPYGITKIAIEKYLYFYKYCYGIDYLVCRYSNPYGKFQNPIKRVGAINFFLYQHLKNQTIEIYGNPQKIIRDYIYIDDLVEVTISLSLRENLTHNLYNIGSGEGYSLKQILNEIEKITHKKVNYKCYPQKNENVKQVILNIERVSKELNWSPQIDLNTGIKLNKKWIEELLSNTNLKSGHDN